MKGFILCILVVISLVQAEYPSNLPKCKKDDAKCIKAAANTYIQKYHNGLKEINLIPFEPLRVKSMILPRNPSSPVNVEFKLKDMDIHGLKNMKIKSFDGFGDFNVRCTFVSEVPELLLDGQYSIDGRVIILPITGSGASQLIAKNVQLKFSYDLKPVEKNGKIYAELDHEKLEMIPGDLHFNFENLFNGDKALGDNMNRFINENWRDFYNELNPIFSEGMGLVIKGLMNAFLSKFPFDDLFL